MLSQFIYMFIKTKLKIKTRILVNMIINWQEEITRIDPEMKFRAEGGWLKTIEKLDKSVKNGYSLVGDFVKAGDFEENYDEGIYLDCNKEKTGRKTQQDYRLFRFRDGKVRLLDMVIDGENGWAVDLWDAVEDEL
ncbi:hypothetical protein EDC42_1219 [Methanobrevibacter gottschalkii DSM 11977]|uniref:Uncharacterized protein n=2 Tax=Methanobrevibacter gottschalkii TaxID=190974 RepID=A0A3N5B3K9_9EURY|nr:hypothetical protein EDC42_1219 [Methanobrevibacter gottschalkii DSM 11977]